MNVHGSKWIRPDKRLALYVRDDFRCVYCYRTLKNAHYTELTLDHLVPRIQGGSNHETNLVTACRPCNSSRQDMPWVDFATKRAARRIAHQTRQPLNIALARDIIWDRQEAAA